MKTPTKYIIPDETPGMVSESLGVATARNTMFKTYPLHTEDTESFCDNMEIPSLQYSIEEIDRHLEESEMQFLSGNFLTIEEADRDMESFINALR